MLTTLACFECMTKTFLEFCLSEVLATFTALPANLSAYAVQHESLNQVLLTHVRGVSGVVHGIDPRNQCTMLLTSQLVLA